MFSQSESDYKTPHTWEAINYLNEDRRNFSKVDVTCWTILQPRMVSSNRQPYRAGIAERKSRWCDFI